MALRIIRIVVFGAGTAGWGSAEGWWACSKRAGLSDHKAASVFWNCIDRYGL